jgi:FtsK/SpoIIIE family
MRERTNDRRLYLGHHPDQDAALSDLVRVWDGGRAAVWPYGTAPHMRVVGTTGGGKSSFLRMLLRGLVRKPGPRAITIIDAEGAGEFTVFEDMPGVAQVINVNPLSDLPSVARAAQAIADTLALSVEMNTDRLNAQGRWRQYLNDPVHHQPPTYQRPGETWLVIDGWGSLRHDLNRYHRAKLDPVEDAVQIGRNGRKTDVHLIIADQVMYASRSRDDDGMPSRLKKQLNCSVAAVGPLGLSKSEASMAFDDPDVKVPAEFGGCLMQIGATRVPFIVPPWPLATDPTAPLSVDDRRAAYRLLPSPETAA